ncbi:MAG: calcium-translocating P-type ATPase, PMCA-type [Muribaculaceae bacterium]|nr:calcium-translocating P-type ATPase, PMCA-type [Muribaculaceae bacterium]
MEKNRIYKGLTESQIYESRKIHGINILTPAKKQNLFSKFLEKFKDPLIIILLIAGLFSIGISIYEITVLKEDFKVFFEPIGIFIAIFLATGMGFLFEFKADKEFALLNQVQDNEPVMVIRNHNHIQVPRKDIVVGDIVILSTGEEIPADGELLEAISLNVDESTLTGEPMAHKTIHPDDFDPEATFPSNKVLRGTKIMEGHGIMRVTAVGDKTEAGKVYEAVQIDDSVKTPLTEQLEGLGGLISKISYIIAGTVIVGRIWMYFVGEPIFDWIPFIAYLLQSFMIAVTLVVVAVPEGLPMAVTLALAFSMRRMLKTHNLVRKMHACETMGATTVICTDKTGTLTQNKMQVADVKEFAGDMALLEENMAVNSTAELDYSGKTPVVLGNPTEGALILFLNDNGINYQIKRAEVKKLDELPFNTERKYMASLVVNKDGKTYLFVKGAPEIVYNLSKEKPGNDEIDSILLEYQNQGMRTLGFAYLVYNENNTIEQGKLKASDLIFQGVAAISDPIRAEVPAAIKEALNAGIDVKIVTGDTPATAKEIGRQVGIWKDDINGEDNIITGTEFEKLSDAEIADRVKDLKIIARARPLDKKRLVESLQAKNEIVAVTGDGTNDAPALKAAHVGLSMGDGTSVAKEVSEITILDNSFSSIGRAVMWGRSLYQNIQRFILFQLTVNVAACLVVLAGAFMGMESPLTVTQMLWVNLIMDTLAAIALSTLPPSKKVMKEKPRSRDAFIISRSMWKFILGVGGLFFFILIGFVYYFEHTNLTSLTQLWSIPFGENMGLSPYELSLFFTIFVFMQFWNMFNARAFMTGRSALHFKDCGWFVFIMLIIFGGQILIVELGREFFNVVPLRFLDWVIIIGVTSIVLWVGELIRLCEKIMKKK